MMSMSQDVAEGYNPAGITLAKALGGAEYVDQFGHKWVEVKVKGASSPVKDGRVPLFNIAGAIAPAAATGYNATTKEPQP